MKTIICGIKLTHDGAVALVEDGRLVFCHEAEKIDNGARFSPIAAGSGAVAEIFRREGIKPNAVTDWVLDGWKGGHIGAGHNLTVAPYHEHDEQRGASVGETPTEPINPRYHSHSHNMGHVLGAYCTAPWSRDLEPAHVLVWDGGQNPRLYFVDPRNPRRGDRVQFVNCLHDLYGIIYGIMGYYWGPYKNTAVQREVADAAARSLPLPVAFGGYEAPGKLMAYIGLGQLHEDWANALHNIYQWLGGRFGGEARRDYHQDGALEHALCAAAKAWFDDNPHPSDPNPEASALLAVHTFLQRLLVAGLCATVPRGGNLAFAGGSALNIKWNSALRDSGWFRRVWVPPFPNDSGSALGAACAQMALKHDVWHLRWGVFSGPAVTPPHLGVPLPAGWTEVGVLSVQSVAHLLSVGEVVVRLKGRAELGPRALGARSILADARSPLMKDRLNACKHREAYRPVAPICLEEFAPVVFEPGVPDPYMLFDHRVRADWAGRVPAIVHVDGTARLQTVSAESDPEMHAVLTEFYRLTGVPLLCNTSANYNGKGFFPSARDAMEWGGARWVWADGMVYHHE